MNPNTTSSFLDDFRQYFMLDDDKWHEYTSCFKRMEVPAKTFLLREGEVAKNVYLIEKGCIRVWFNNEGKDMTFQFFFENSTVSSLESFRKNIPSYLYVETLEPSVLWYIGKQDVEGIIAEVSHIPVLREKIMEAMFSRTLHYMQHFFSFIRDTPKQRYLNLVQENPQIILRVPQHYIASYLGVSTVHLSRIKSSIAKENRKRGI
jgi:CRP-like cAMP-binding protein